MGDYHTTAICLPGPVPCHVDEIYSLLLQSRVDHVSVIVPIPSPSYLREAVYKFYWHAHWVGGMRVNARVSFDPLLT